MNTLLKVEASIHAVPLTDLNLTCREFDADGGIDGRVKWPATAHHDVLPPGELVVQYKTGKVTKTILRGELHKPRVQEALKAGCSYLVMASHDHNDRQVRTLRQNLGELCEEGGIDLARCQLLFAEQLAHWACRHPSIFVMPEFRKGLPAFVTVARWRQQPDLANPWRPDQVRQDIIQKVRALVCQEMQDPIIRIEGSAGVGKSRLVLEAFSHDGLAERTIYAENAGDPHVQQLLASNQSDAAASAIVVIGECDRNRQDVLSSYAQLALPRLRLVCVGPGEILQRSPYESGNLFVLQPLDVEKVREALRAAIPNLPPDAVEASTRLSGGYVKLAFFVARALERSRMMPVSELRRIYTIGQFLKKFMEPGRLKVLQAVSLLSRLGWAQELRDEARAVSEYLAIPFADFQSGVKFFKDKGVVVPRGRYLHVTPELLAIHCAAELWEERGPDLIKIVKHLPGSAATRELLKRLAMIGEHGQARSAVTMLLSEEGLFKNLDDLDNGFLSGLYRILASGAPDAAVEVLTRVIERAPRDRLLAFEKGRRNVMWAIESLLRWPEASLSAARSLRALALAENESWGNNATGIFAEYFHVRLSRSPMPFSDRLPLIDELIESGDETSRLLASRAAAAALTAFESRSGGNVDDLSARPYPPEWRPSTWGDYWDAVFGAAERLQKISGGRDEASRQARKALLHSVYALARVAKPDKAVEILESLSPENDGERIEVLEACGRLAEASSRPLTPNEIDRLDEVRRKAYSNTYFDRLRRWIGRRPHTDYDGEGETGFRRADQETRQLAEEGFEKGITDQELAWLASGEAINVWEFGKRLGELDANRQFLSRTVAVAPNDYSSIFATSFMEGVAIASGPQSREKILDELALSNPQLAFTCTWRGRSTEPGYERLIRLVESAAVQPEELSVLRYGGWALKLNSDQIKKVLELMGRGDRSKILESAMGILHHHLEKYPDSTAQLEPLMWHYLEVKPGRSGTMMEWEWGKLAERLAPRNPARMVKIVIDMFESDMFVPLEDDPAMKALKLATEADGDAAWKLVGPALLRDDKIAAGLVVALSQWYGELIPIDTLVEWARTYQPHAPLIAARLVHVKETPMPERARALILAFGGSKDMRVEILANLETGGGVGPFSGFVERELRVVVGWIQDPDPVISAWAVQVAKSMRKALQRQRLLEEEEER